MVEHGLIAGPMHDFCEKHPALAFCESVIARGKEDHQYFDDTWEVKYLGDALHPQTFHSKSLGAMNWRAPTRQASVNYSRAARRTDLPCRAQGRVGHE